MVRSAAISDSFNVSCGVRSGARVPGGAVTVGEKSATAGASRMPAGVGSVGGVTASFFAGPWSFQMDMQEMLRVAGTLDYRRPFARAL